MLIWLGHAIICSGYLIQGTLLYVSLRPDIRNLLLLPLVLLAPYLSRTLFGNCIFVKMSNVVFKVAGHRTYRSSFAWTIRVVGRKYAFLVNNAILFLVPLYAAGLRMIMYDLGPFLR